jgi:hypothetical protein
MLIRSVVKGLGKKTTTGMQRVRRMRRSAQNGWMCVGEEGGGSFRRSFKVCPKVAILPGPRQSCMVDGVMDDEGETQVDEAEGIDRGPDHQSESAGAHTIETISPVPKQLTTARAEYR